MLRKVGNRVQVVRRAHAYDVCATRGIAHAGIAAVAGRRGDKNATVANRVVDCILQIRGAAADVAAETHVDQTAPLSAANVIPAARSVNVPFPSQSRTLSGRIRAPGAIPATPAPLFICAAIVPDTCVPCVNGSGG